MSERYSNNHYTPLEILARTPINSSLNEAEKKLLSTFKDTFYWYNMEKDNRKDILKQIQSLPRLGDGSMDSNTEAQFKELQRRNAEAAKRIDSHLMQLKYLAETKELKRIVISEQIRMMAFTNNNMPESRKPVQNTDAQDTEKQKPKQKSSVKEKLVSALGAFGGILYFVIRTIVAVLPFVMIGGGFWFSFLLISLNAFFPFASIVFWIWGLVCAIKGVQDVFAIIYYVAFAVLWMPFYINLALSLLKGE